MPTRIRLQRHGKKGKPFYYIVAADSRAKRDGKYIERLGSYNPNTNPATIDIDFDSCLNWVASGAQPSDTCRAMLKYKGVMHKHHLNGGVLKGALTQEQADAKFDKWLAEKEGKVQGKIDGLAKADADAEKKRLAAETEVKEKRASELQAKASELAAAAEAEVKAAEEAAAPAEEATEEAAPEAPTAEADAPATEEKPAE